MVKLDILSDPICPWCYIGKRTSTARSSANPEHPFAIEWHPFQLNPDMAPEGVDRAAYLEEKFGGREKAVRIYARVDAAAEAAGLTIDWAAIKRVPNTLDAHRVIHWAGLEGRQTPVVGALFRAFFREGRDIGDRAVLLDIAEATGLDRAMTQRLFESGADADDIRARDAHARKRGVTGVPTFIVANQHVVQGAQPAELWDQVIGEITAQLKADAP